MSPQTPALMSEDGDDTTLSLTNETLSDRDILAVNHLDPVEDASQKVVSMTMTHRDTLLMLPLELQECIIASGPHTMPDRVAFLCKCALVCKDWVPKSRSLLKLSQKTSSRWDTLVSLTQDPLTTLAYAMRDVYVYNRTWSIHTLQVLHCHISRLCLYMVDIKVMVPHMAIIPTVRILKLKYIHFETSYDDFSALMDLFPALHTLSLSRIVWPPHKLAGFDIIGPYTTLHTLSITTATQSDIAVLDPLLPASPFLQRLGFHLDDSDKAWPLSEWISQTSICQTGSAGLHVSLKFSNVCLRWFELREDDGMDVILGCTQSIIIPAPTEDDISDTLPLWIAEAPHLKNLEVSAADRHYSLGENLAHFTALGASLASAKKELTVRFTKWEDYSQLERYLEILRVLVHPQVSVLVQMDPSSDELTRIY